MLGRDRLFALSHRHSVAKLPWVDEFRVGPGNELVLYRTRFGAFGAGLPSGDEGGTVSLEDGWIVIDGMDRRFASIALAPGAGTEHRLAIGGRAWALWPLAARRTPLTMAAEHVPLGPALAWRLVHAGGLRRAAAAAGPQPTMDGGEGGGS